VVPAGWVYQVVGEVASRPPSPRWSSFPSEELPKAYSKGAGQEEVGAVRFRLEQGMRRGEEADRLFLFWVKASVSRGAQGERMADRVRNGLYPHTTEVVENDDV